MHYVAMKSDVNIATISKIEAGKQQSLKYDKIERLAKATGVNVHWLMTGEGDMTPPRTKREASSEHERTERTRAPQTSAPSLVDPASNLGRALALFPSGTFFEPAISILATKQLLGELDLEPREWVHELVELERKIKTALGVREPGTYSSVYRTPSPSQK